jgi:hypothetical protein
VSRKFYENAIRTNEQWLKAIWYPLLKAGNPEQRETVKVEYPTPDNIRQPYAALRAAV